MSGPTLSKSSRALYVLLALYILASLTYYVANIAGFIDNYFDLHHRSEAPFQFNIDSLQIVQLTPDAQQAGLAVGDTLVSVEGSPYSGKSDWLTLIRNRVHPGDGLKVTARQSNGKIKSAHFLLTERSSPRPAKFSEYGSTLLLFGIPPLICLLIGYWIVIARPRDPNAWLILLMMSFPGTFFTVSQNWWPGYLDFYSSAWAQLERVLAPLALVLFGLYFPERWRLDRKLPWVKWLLIGLALLAAVVLIWVAAREDFYPAWTQTTLVLNCVTNQIVHGIEIACILLYGIAIFDKLRSASTTDARRRLNVLGAGSLIGLGSLLVFFGLFPLLHIDIHRQWIGNIASIAFLAFPFSLAYVMVVQRAVDMRILLRTGTKYALARATLTVIRTGLFTALIVLLIAAFRSSSLTPKPAIAIIVLAGLLLLLRSRFTKNLSFWFDRKFFREAYNAEQLLAELSHRVRKYNESGPMLEMVLKNLAETLHIDKIAVLLRGGNALQLQSAIGISRDVLAGNQPVQLPLNSVTVRNLMRVNTPVKLYRDNPDGWFLLANKSERSLLDAMSTELLLPLSGRDQLLGLITLGPKRSEEPYTTSDLRLLESVATQTGLALEIGELARSLANEATQRELIHREIEVAREVQERLFPQEFPVIDGVSLAGHCRTQQGVGGDYYDSFVLDDGRMGLAVGDVSGKGISAALLMASLRASVRGMALDAPHDLAVMMEKVNRLVYEASASNRYATFFFATYDMKTRELIYVNAGHNAPFLIHRKGDDFHVERLEAGGPVIGLLPSATYQEQRLVLEPGDLLLAYTDGISEAMTESEEEWGEERMLAAAHTLPDGSAQQLLEHLFSEADRFTGKAAQFDDMTLLVLKLEMKPA